jgi:hypothetical protein
MGNLGRKLEPSRKKRPSPKRRRGSEANQLLDFLPDGFRTRGEFSKKVMAKWLGQSFIMANMKIAHQWVLSDQTIDDAKLSIEQVASAISGELGDCRITITKPENQYPYWTNRIEMTVDGIRHESELEDLDFNALMQKSIGWLNQKGIV